MTALPARGCAWLSLLPTLLVVAGCGSSGSSTNQASESTEIIVSATPPFQTKEPERYRATRTITTVNARGESSTTTTAIARDGNLRRHESETAGVRVAYLNTPEGRFILLLDDNLFAELTNENGGSTNADNQPPELAPERLLHAEQMTTSYQNLGSETIGGRSANKYRVVVNSSPAANVTLTETLIWIDEALRMPIKSETRSQDGTRVTMELSDIAFDVESRLFQIPNDYEKVTFSELRKRLRKTKEPTSASQSGIN